MRCATISSSRSPTWWPRVSLTSLNRSRSSSATESRQVRTLDGLGQPLQQELAVGQAGQRVVQGLVLLDQRHARRLVHGEHRDQQERHEPRAAHRREHDEWREREDGGGGHDVVDDVLGERLPERLPDVGSDARHEHVVHDEPDHPREDDPDDVATGEAEVIGSLGVGWTPNASITGPPVAATLIDVLTRVEEDLPRFLAPHQLARKRRDGHEHERGRESPDVEDREHERVRGDGPLRVVRAGGAHGAQLAQQDERGDDPERRRASSPISGWTLTAATTTSAHPAHTDRCHVRENNDGRANEGRAGLSPIHTSPGRPSADETPALV